MAQCCLFLCGRHLGEGCEQQMRGGLVEKASLTTWPGQHRSWGCFCCRGAAGDLGNSFARLPQKFCYLCCVFITPENLVLLWVSCRWLWQSVLIECLHVALQGKDFPRCPADWAVQVLTFLPGLENSSFVPAVFEIAVKEPESGQSFWIPSIFMPWVYVILKFSGQF